MFNGVDSFPFLRTFSNRQVVAMETANYTVMTEIIKTKQHLLYLTIIIHWETSL